MKSSRVKSGKYVPFESVAITGTVTRFVSVFRVSISCGSAGAGSSAGGRDVFGLCWVLVEDCGIDPTHVAALNMKTNAHRKNRENMASLYTTSMPTDSSWLLANSAFTKMDGH
jgi:hypothetical protein